VVAYERWQEEAAQERSRLLAALRHFTEGGIVEDIQHIGATSVPGLTASPSIDLALAVSPFPLTAEALTVFAALGYRLAAGRADALEQRLDHTTGSFRLLVSESGSDEWMDHLLVRDYLRNDEEARRQYMTHQRSWTALAGERPEATCAKAVLFAGLLARAQPWWIGHHGFGPVEAVTQELEGCGFPWYISSGWALDLFLGQVTRVHHDVDVVVARADQLALYEHMTGRGWKFVTPLHGRLEPWPAHMRLELPRHQAHTHRAGQFIDFLLTDMADSVWRYRRNPAAIRALDRAGLRSSQGIPFLAPELVLLFKSKNTGNRERDKDQADFERVYPQLAPEPRAWLRWALVATDPAHPWIDLLI
jgi:GrpB-like predicted nucleotidyltransferase (UPF0157 family)